MRRVKLLLVGLVFSGLILWGGVVPSATSQAQGNVSHLNTNRISVIDGGARLVVIEYNRHGPPYRFEIVDASTLAVVEAVALDVEGEILGISANGEWVVYRRSTGGHAVLNWITGEDDILTPGGPVPIPEASLVWNPVDGRIFHAEGTMGLLSRAIYGPEAQGGAVHNAAHPGIGAVAWSPDGTRLATAGTGHIAVWEGTQLASVLATQPAHELAGTGWGLAWDPTGRYLAALGETCAIHIYAVDEETLAQILPCPTDTTLFALAWSPDGTQIAAGHMNGIFEWDLSTGEVHDAYAAERPVGALVWLPIGLVHDGDAPGLYLDGVPITAPRPLIPTRPPA